MVKVGVRDVREHPTMFGPLLTSVSALESNKPFQHHGQQTCAVNAQQRSLEFRSDLVHQTNQMSHRQEKTPSSRPLTSSWRGSVDFSSQYGIASLCTQGLQGEHVQQDHFSASEKVPQTKFIQTTT